MSTSFDVEIVVVGESVTVTPSVSRVEVTPGGVASFPFSTEPAGRVAKDAHFNGDAGVKESRVNAAGDAVELVLEVGVPKGSTVRGKVTVEF